MNQFAILMFLAIFSFLFSCQSVEQKAKNTLAKMTNDEKYLLLNGVGWDANGGQIDGYYIGNTVSITLQNDNTITIPTINMQDGPQGFRTTSSSMLGEITSWPCSMGVASTFDTDLMLQWGIALGQEHRAKGANQILGPGVNFNRVPRGGRNAEYLTGEDPYLGAIMTSAYIQGVQSQGVMATVKHYILNNQENWRNNVSANVDLRTLHEIYLPPFDAAIRAGVSSFMCAYSLVNDTYACGNDATLKTILKEQLGFKGWVMSDWWATHGPWIDRGLDQNMPGNGDTYFSPSTLKKFNISIINDSVYRILLQMYTLGLINTNPVCNNINGKGCNNYLNNAKATSKEHIKLARAIAAASASLLKNDYPVTRGAKIKILPLTSLQPNATITFIGSACDQQQDIPKMLNEWNLGNYYIVGGSGRVISPDTISIYAGVKQRGEQLGYRVLIDKSDNIRSSLKSLSESDVAILCGGSTTTEGNDRANLLLDQDAFINKILAANNRRIATIVAISSPGPVLTNFRHLTDGVINMFLAGQQTGPAWADILFGDVNPSGRLPVTFPVSEANNIQPCDGSVFPLQCNYKEGLFVGYRGLGLHEPVAFPFGHGLSYTQFQYTWITLPSNKCTNNAFACFSYSIFNVGAVDGHEVSQAYISFPSVTKSPALQLFSVWKVFLKKGELKNHTVNIVPRDVAYFDVISNDWKIAPGNYAFYIGGSSRESRITGVLRIDSETAQKTKVYPREFTNPMSRK